MRWSLLSLATLVAVTAGCGSEGPVTHQVQGTVQLATGSPAALAGSTVETVLVDQPHVRAFGTINDEGRFELETLHGGKIKAGAVAGKYNARIILADDDAEQRRLAAQAVNPRFLQFETSGLSFDVPSQGEVVLPLSK